MTATMKMALRLRLEAEEIFLREFDKNGNEQKDEEVAVPEEPKAEEAPKVEEKPVTVEPEIKEETPKNNNYGGKNNKHRR